MKLVRAVGFTAIALVLLCAGTWYVSEARWSVHSRASRPANMALRDATLAMRNDTMSGYQEASQKAEFALSLDATAETNRNARGLLAYTWTILWGEHLHDATSRARAEEFIRAGLKNEERSGYLLAAEALFLLYDGKLVEGLQTIDARIAAAEADQKHVYVYYLVRGQLQLAQGNREAAKRSFARAQEISPGEPRVVSLLESLASPR